jgi:hypothetical protein
MALPQAVAVRKHPPADMNREPDEPREFNRLQVSAFRFGLFSH